MQRGVSGNKFQGCDAIIVAGKRSDGLGEDNFLHLWYWAETKVSGGAILKSARDALPIRVFRPAGKERSTTLYRYDGIYVVVQVKIVKSGSSRQSHFEWPQHKVSNAIPGTLYGFLLVRIGQGTCPSSNKMAGHELWQRNMDAHPEEKSFDSWETLVSFTQQAMRNARCTADILHAPKLCPEVPPLESEPIYTNPPRSSKENRKRQSGSRCCCCLHCLSNRDANMGLLKDRRWSDRKKKTDGFNC
jgi:hypothetical protein